MSFVATFMVLSLLGIATTLRLIWQHHRKKEQPLVCPLNHDCSVVTESRWSHIFYVRNEVLGLLFYLGMLAAGTGMAFIGDYAGLLRIIIKLSTAFGALFSLFLIFIQIKVIKDYCFYCLISALLTLLLAVNGFYL